MSIRRYIEVNRNEHANLCEILDLLLDEVEHLKDRVHELEHETYGPPCPHSHGHPVDTSKCADCANDSGVA